MDLYSASACSRPFQILTFHFTTTQQCTKQMKRPRRKLSNPPPDPPAISTQVCIPSKHTFFPTRTPPPSHVAPSPSAVQGMSSYWSRGFAWGLGSEQFGQFLHLSNGAAHMAVPITNHSTRVLLPILQT